MDESECLAEFRVRKQDITLLADVLQLQVTIRCHQRTTCDRTEALCMLLKRFSYPCRYSDMIHRFARPVSEISMITNTVTDHIFLSHGHRISQWNLPMLSMQKVHLLTIALGLLMELSYQFLALANTKE